MFTRVQQACFELSSTFSQCQITGLKQHHHNINTTYMKTAYRELFYSMHCGFFWVGLPSML